jgi:hypothetical protein
VPYQNENFFFVTEELNVDIKYLYPGFKKYPRQYYFALYNLVRLSLSNDVHRRPSKRILFPTDCLSEVQ